MCGPISTRQSHFVDFNYVLCGRSSRSAIRFEAWDVARGNSMKLYVDFIHSGVIVPYDDLPVLLNGLLRSSGSLCNGTCERCAVLRRRFNRRPPGPTTHLLRSLSTIFGDKLSVDLRVNSPRNCVFLGGHVLKSAPL